MINGTLLRVIARGLRGTWPLRCIWHFGQQHTVSQLLKGRLIGDTEHLGDRTGIVPRQKKTSRRRAGQNEFAREGIGLRLAPLLDAIGLDSLIGIAAIGFRSRIKASLGSVVQFEMPDLMRHDLGALIGRQVISEKHLPELAREQTMRAFQFRIV